MDFYALNDLPKPKAMDPAVRDYCVLTAAKHFSIHPDVIQAILKVEGGKVGTVSRNTNGSYDLGPMQINSIHLKNIKKHFPNVTWRELAYKPCVNIGVGTWILYNRLQETPNFWKGVGNYHSKTDKHRRTYLRKVYRAYASILRAKWANLQSQRLASATMPPGATPREFIQ